jgi:hypothetical protein
MHWTRMVMYISLRIQMMVRGIGQGAREMHQSPSKRATYPMMLKKNLGYLGNGDKYDFW